jgi:site-specific DNA recombinase
MRVVIYVRVSTDAQERDGSSLESQEVACRDFVDRGGWHLVEIVRDTASGYTLDRPGMQRVRHLLRQQAIDVVLAHAVDRLSRKQNHMAVLFEEILDAGATLECVTEKFEDSAIGRFILMTRAFAAEVEREKIVERTMRGKTARANAGKLPQATGKGIYGYRYNPATGQREIEPAQAEIVRRIFTLFVAGESCHGVTTALNRDDIPSLSGGPGIR